MEKSSCFKLVFLVFLLLNISASTLARMQPTIMEELTKEQVLEELGAYKQIIASAATRDRGELLRTVIEAVARPRPRPCIRAGGYCNILNVCCAGLTCEEHDIQDAACV
ncbi:hypothetical protein BVRB_013550 [Beta vulgaris subsp. vulgaris]|uniref:Uncharacterized protein n=1 Tax=Beta vulgaris subsp. vulgaris TaxID=3555 RepID=A0A0J8B1R8_BETVV|nr:hypothetical protein BVRB_013550 [Beta vulgaris subsp. vulgaris]